MSHFPRMKQSRGTVGIPRVLNMYENYPFWFTVLHYVKIPRCTLSFVHKEDL